MGESEEPATSQLQASQGIVQALKRGSDGVKTGEMPDKAKRLLYINQLSYLTAKDLIRSEAAYVQD